MINKLFILVLAHAIFIEGTIFSDIISIFIPFYKKSIITTFLCIFYILFVLYHKKVLFKFDNTFIFFVILLLILSIDILQCNLSNNSNLSLVIYTIKNTLLLLVLLIQTRISFLYALNTKIIKFYVLFIIISSWLLFTLIYLGQDVGKSLISTDFLRKNDEGNLGKSLYSFPLGLGLFITGQNYASLGSIVFPQFCSYYIEPQIFCFNYFPLLFLYLSNVNESIKNIYC